MLFHAFLRALLAFLRVLLDLVEPAGKISIRSTSIASGNPPPDPGTNKITLR